MSYHKILWLLALLLPLLGAEGVAASRIQHEADTTGREVVIETTMGRIRVQLYDDTPRHRDNFLRLVGEGYYDSLLFHRVIPGFVIQAGDSASRHAAPGAALGDSPEPYSVPAEIHFPRHYHKAGALAAAREPDETNPTRASSASQFYIVTGRLYDDDGLTAAQAYLDSVTAGQVKLTPEIKEVYRSQGGMPYLDGLYTVFGEVVEGMDIVDQIQWVERDARNRPLSDVRILKAYVVKPRETLEAGH